MAKRKAVERAVKVARVNLRQFALADLKDHPQNPRIHPDPGTPEWNALKASLSSIYFDPIVVNLRRGANYMTLVSGHLRRKVLTELGYTAADASTVDVDDATHLAMMLAANKQQGQNDDAKMAPILFSLQAIPSFNVQMTGFTMPEIADICVGAGMATREVKFNAKVNGADMLNEHIVIVEFTTEQEQEEFYGEMNTRGIKCRLA